MYFLVLYIFPYFFPTELTPKLYYNEVYQIDENLVVSIISEFWYFDWKTISKNSFLTVFDQVLRFQER